MLPNINKDKVLIIDFGSQVTKLIARRIRELGVYSEIITPRELAKLKNYNNIKGLIFSELHRLLLKKNLKQFQKKYSKKNTYFRYLLWITVNSKIIWW